MRTYSSQADAMEFVDQAESDEIITDLETVLSRAREEFKIYPEERSAIFGDLTIEYTVPRFEGRRLNLSSHPDGYLIGPSLVRQNLLILQQRWSLLLRREVFSLDLLRSKSRRNTKRFL